MNIYTELKEGGAGVYNISMRVLVDKVDENEHHTRLIIRGTEANSFISAYGSNYYCSVTTPIDVTAGVWCYLSGNIIVSAEAIK